MTFAVERRFNGKWPRLILEAGVARATVPEIAAITGHTIHRTQYILEHYLPRDVHMARAGIVKLERKK